MAKYVIHLVETQEYTLTIDADTEEEATQLAYAAFDNNIPETADLDRITWSGQSKPDSNHVLAACVEHPDGTHTYND